MPSMSSADVDIRVVSPSGIPYGPFRTFDGGDLTKAPRRVRPPGQGEEAAHNPNGTRGDITLVKDASTTDDWDAAEAEAGHTGWRVNVVKKDDNGIAFGKPDVYLCVLDDVNRPKWDTNAGETTSEGGFVLACNEKMGQGQ